MLAFWRWRLMTYAILLFTLAVVVVFAFVIFFAIISTTDCDSIERASDRQACEAGLGIGYATLAGGFFCAWFVGFVILSIIWFMTRPVRRACPRCGSQVPEGDQTCRRCGFNFRSLAPPLPTD